MKVPAEKTYIGYCRVSTAVQGVSGLGLESQQAAVRRFVGDGKLAAEFIEVESGRNNERPQLAAALLECRRRRATLVIAKLDRLSRNVRFVATLLESNVPIICADMPTADRMVLQMMSVVAEREAEMISARTKAALAAAKARGVRLGGTYNFDAGDRVRGSAAGARVRTAKAQERALELAPVIKEIKAAGGTTLKAIAAGLTARGIDPPRGGAWQLCSVSKLVARI
jgi:DNA invertase Pin-like site-specific DNA recombinase